MCVGVYVEWLKEAVTAYNEQSSKYEIVVLQHKEDERIEDYRSRMKQKLASGVGPDIISYGALEDMDMKSYAEAGVFMDMTDFLVSREGLCDKAVEFNLVKGKLYGVPVSFTFDTFTIERKENQVEKC